MASSVDVGKRQLVIFAILFAGYAFYGLNRKAVSLVLPELIQSGLDKRDAGLKRSRDSTLSPFSSRPP